MGLFGNKYKKIKRTDVVDAIVELEKRQQQELSDIEARNVEIDANMEKGRKSKDRNLQLALAKRINMLKAENAAAAKRIQYLNGNISALNQLKTALDEREFVLNNSKLPMNKLFSDTAALKKFLNEVTISKQQQESDLGDVLDIFEEHQENNEGDERIYGVSKSDDALLSMFEQQNTDDEIAMFGTSGKSYGNLDGAEE